MSKIQNCWVIIPAFNESKRIGNVIKKVQQCTRNVIVVDDGSTDATYKVAKKYKVIVLKHEINLGKGAAMKTGVEAAMRLGADTIILLDADGQHNPNHIPQFTEQITKGFDIVFGARDLRFKTPVLRFLGNRIGAFLISLFFGIYRADLLCGFLAFTKEAYTKIKWDSARYGVETEITAKTGKNRLKYIELPIETIYIDKYKGVTILDSLGVLFNIPRWLIK